MAEVSSRSLPVARSSGTLCLALTIAISYQELADCIACELPAWQRSLIASVTSLVGAVAANKVGTLVWSAAFARTGDDELGRDQVLGIPDMVHDIMGRPPLLGAHEKYLPANIRSEVAGT